jgi:hypothetical protein
MRRRLDTNMNLESFFKEGGKDKQIYASTA